MKQAKTPKQRTIPQNKALHKYCGELAQDLNEAGITMEVFFKNMEVDHTMESVKAMFQAFAQVKYGKRHTSELTTIEMTELYEEVNRHVAQFGIHRAWPSYEDTENYLNTFVE